VCEEFNIDSTTVAINGAKIMNCFYHGRFWKDKGNP
jgi:hypothetical protein